MVKIQWLKMQPLKFSKSLVPLYPLLFTKKIIEIKKHRNIFEYLSQSNVRCLFMGGAYRAVFFHTDVEILRRNFGLVCRTSFGRSRERSYFGYRTYDFRIFINAHCRLLIKKITEKPLTVRLNREIAVFKWQSTLHRVSHPDVDTLRRISRLSLAPLSIIIKG